MSMLNVFNIAGSALAAQSARLNAVASNLANADSVAGPDGQPYRAKQVVFAAPAGRGRRRRRARHQVVESAAPLRMVYDPKNPAADGQGYGGHAQRERPSRRW
jgi:flagellar basal-body rod protein FlgC